MSTAIAVVAAISARDTALWSWRWWRRKKLIECHKAQLANYIAKLRAEEALKHAPIRPIP